MTERIYKQKIGLGKSKIILLEKICIIELCPDFKSFDYYFLWKMGLKNSVGNVDNPKPDLMFDN